MSDEKKPRVDPAKLEAFKATHGAHRVFTLDRGELGVLVFRKATGAEYRRLTMKIAENRANAYDANEELLRACVLEPSGPALDALLDEYPGLVLDIGGEIALVANNDHRTEAKKA